MLCGTAWRVRVSVAGTHFDELRELCTAAGDQASLAIAMAGAVFEHAYHARIREASELASEIMALVESIGDPNLTVGLSPPVLYTKVEAAEYSDALRWAERVIDLADGEASKGDFLIGSPVSFAYASRAIARYAHGRPGWRDDLRYGLDTACSADPLIYAGVVGWGYVPGISNGALLPDDSVMREIEGALRIAERSGDDLAVANDKMALGMALVHRSTDAERARGQQLLTEVAEVFVRREHNLADLPITNVYVARERARRGDRDEAIPPMRVATDHLFRDGRVLLWTPAATGVLVETLLDRGAEGDVAEAEAAIERLTAAPAEDGLVIRDIWLLRMRALMARARGDAATYADVRARYRTVAESHGYEGHIEWAAKMTEDR
jgi:hypothetical protein